MTKPSKTVEIEIDTKIEFLQGAALRMDAIGAHRTAEFFREKLRQYVEELKAKARSRKEAA